MNEGKEKLEALRRNLKKKANHIPPKVSTNTGQDVKQVQEQSSNKIPIEQRLENKDKERQNSNNALNVISQPEAKKDNEKQNNILAGQAKKSDEQGLQEGQIKEEQNQLAEEKQVQLINNLQTQQKPQQSNIINPQQNQKHKEVPQQSVPMELQPQVAQENEKKNENNTQQNSDKIIEEKEKIIESEEKANLGQISKNTNTHDQNHENNAQKQQIQKVAGSNSVHQTQNLNLQSTLSHQNNSVHKSQGRVHHQSSKPAIKIVLKELQMIKSSIHNLNVTYRGVEYLRERIKKDTVLKRKIRERLIDLQGDNEMDVLRKLVKQVQTSCQKSTETHQKSLTASAKHHHLPHHPHADTNNKPSQLSQPIISQPQIQLSNDLIDY